MSSLIVLSRVVSSTKRASRLFSSFGGPICAGTAPEKRIRHKSGSANPGRFFLIVCFFFFFFLFRVFLLFRGSLHSSVVFFAGDRSPAHLILLLALIFPRSCKEDHRIR